MGGDHPIAWCQDVGQGRSWYTGLGHAREQWATPELQEHVLGGLLAVMGRVPANCAP
jgi:cytochrome c